MAVSTSLIARGIVGIAVGIVAFTWPGLTITAVVLLFGVYALLDGIWNVAHGVVNRPSAGHAWLLIAEGALGIAAGVVTFAWPAITLVILVILVGVWAFATGILELVAAIGLRHVLAGEWLLAVSGVLSIVLGALLFAFPIAGAVVLAFWFGAYALVAGIILVALGMRLRRHAGLTPG
jgi:uncharacterized membrane protein HdeD (DUF308 family)